MSDRFLTREERNWVIDEFAEVAMELDHDATEFEVLEVLDRLTDEELIEEAEAQMPDFRADFEAMFRVRIVDT